MLGRKEAPKPAASALSNSKGVVNANVQTVDAIIMGHYDGNMVATGNIEIAATGRVSNVTKINEEGSLNGARPVYLIEEKRAGQQILQR